MSKTTGIEWADATWNPWQGCHKIDEGCQNCYMYQEKLRFGQNPTRVIRSKPATFNAPLKWTEPRRIFVCSWSDFFVKEADEWREEAYQVMCQTPWHTYMVLTKRPERIKDNTFPENMWIGVSVSRCGIRGAQRIEGLLSLKSPILRFVSFEPLLQRVTCSLDGINWVICGCESGPYRRPFDEWWARDLRDQCLANNIPFFYKQGRDEQGKVVRLPKLDGQVWAQIPDVQKGHNDGRI